MSETGQNATLWLRCAMSAIGEFSDYRQGPLSGTAMCSRLGSDNVTLGREVLEEYADARSGRRRCCRAAHDKGDKDERWKPLRCVVAGKRRRAGEAAGDPASGEEACAALQMMTPLTYRAWISTVRHAVSAICL